MKTISQSFSVLPEEPRFCTLLCPKTMHVVKCSAKRHLKSHNYSQKHLSIHESNSSYDEIPSPTSLSHLSKWNIWFWHKPVGTVFTICKGAQEIKPLLGTYTHSEKQQSGSNENENPTPKGKTTAQEGEGSMQHSVRTHVTQRQKLRETAQRVSKRAIKFSNNAYVHNFLIQSIPRVRQISTQKLLHKYSQQHIHKSQKVETTHMSITDKQNVVCPYNGLLFSHKKE